MFSQKFWFHLKSERKQTSNIFDVKKKRKKKKKTSLMSRNQALRLEESMPREVREGLCLKVFHRKTWYPTAINKLNGTTILSVSTFILIFSSLSLYFFFKIWTIVIRINKGLIYKDKKLVDKWDS